MKKGTHIGFCGIDGSGKSTQAVLINKWLKQKKIDSICYDNNRNFVQEVTNNIAISKGLNSGRALLPEHLYILCMSFEVLRNYLVNIKSQTLIGTTIITSRTIIDWIAGSVAKNNTSEEFTLAKEIFLLGGVPDILIWIDVDPKLALKRISKRGIDTANLEYLIKYRLSFAKVLKDYSHCKIDGNGDVNDTFNMIKHKISNLL